jgi:hypothetical protein
VISPADLQAWLESRGDDVPASLWAAIVHAVANAPTSRSVPEGLRLVADRLLEAARRGGDDPHTLLAADALVTYACEARAEESPGSLSDVQ